MKLGYYISQPKSTLLPVQRMVHLGFGIDSSLMAFYLTDKIRAKFRGRREELLAKGTCNEKQMQSFLGKCNHLKSVFPPSSLFTFHSRQFVSSLDENQSVVPPLVLDELRFWGFVDSQTEPVPFRSHQHLRLELFTDASGYGYGAVVSLSSGVVVLRDYWRSELLSEDICVKEALAVLLALQALPESIRGRRVDVYVDNEGLFHAWSGLRSSSLGLVGVLKELFFLCLDFNIDLRLHWVSTHSNPADAPSRALSRADAALSDRLRLLVWNWHGPFSWDLMALPSNVFCLPGSRPLRFFSPFPVPGSAGVDVFSQRPPSGTLYAFPPFVMVPALVGLLAEWGALSVVLVLPTGSLLSSSWYPRLSPYIADRLRLAGPADQDVVLLPSAKGFIPNRLPLGFGLMAFFCRFPPSPSIAVLAPPLTLRILFVTDSVFRPLARLSWPAPCAVEVLCFSGGSLRSVLIEGFQRLSFCPFDALLFHAGVNDVSSGSADFQASFQASVDYASQAVSAFFPGKPVLCSAVIQTRLSELNQRVCCANTLLRSLCSKNNWRFISHDNIFYPDLSDNVHLNPVGIAKLYRSICFALRALSG